MIALWVAAWVVIGLDVARQVREVGRIGTTVARVGSAVSDAGAALEGLRDLPLVGSRIGDAGRPVREAGQRAVATARQSRASATSLSRLLGWAISTVPTLPLLLLYLPQRIAVVRDRRAVLRGLRDTDDDELQQTLAQRAVVHVPLHRLQAVTPTPQADLAGRRYAALACAELERLGVTPPRHWRAAAAVER